MTNMNWMLCNDNGTEHRTTKAEADTRAKELRARGIEVEIYNVQKLEAQARTLLGR